MSKILLDDSKIELYKTEYAETHCVFLPGFLKGALRDSFLNKIATADFYTKFESHSDNQFGKVTVLGMKDPILFSFLFMMNNQQLFKQLQQITGCETIGNFTGRIHRSEAGEDHEIHWHGDNSDNRLIAITLNLGHDKFSGGKFQIRKKGTENIIREFGQTEAGDAFIFQIDPSLQHRLTTVEDGRRTVGVGWFRSQPDFNTFAKEYLKPF